MNDVYFVTIANTGYFDLAKDLILSVLAGCIPELNLGVLDVGLTENEIDQFREMGVVTVPAEWEFSGVRPDGLPRSFLAMLSRPFIPKYFPGQYTYVYLDSDTWIQDSSAIKELVEACRVADIAAVPELHVSYSHLYSPNSGTRSMHRHAFAVVYGTDIAPADSVIINSGVFAARWDSPVWLAWQGTLAAAIAAHMPIKKTSDPQNVTLITMNPAMHFIEQNALNLIFYRDSISLQVMSPLYNWICTLAMPLFDPADGTLIEPAPPYAKIKIVHLTAAGRKATQVFDRYGTAHERGLRRPEH